MEENNKFRKDTKLYIYTDIDSYNKMIENFNKDLGKEKLRKLLTTGYSGDINPCDFLTKSYKPISEEDKKLYSWGTPGKFNSQDLKKAEEIFLNTKKNGRRT